MFHKNLTFSKREDFVATVIPEIHLQTIRKSPPDTRGFINAYEKEIYQPRKGTPHKSIDRMAIYIMSQG